MARPPGKDTIWIAKTSFGRKMRRIHFPRWRKVIISLTKQSDVDIDAELSRYKQDATRLTQQTGVSSVEEVGNLYVLSSPF